MSAPLEFEGKNLDKAIEKACSELNLSQNQLRYEILSYGSSGIFGLVGAKKAKIRVNVASDEKTTSPEIPIPPNPGIDETAAGETPLTMAQIPADQLEAVARTGLAVLEELANHMVDDATIGFKLGTQEVRYQVNSGNSALLIGKRGQTLEALQYLLDKILNKTRTEKIRIHVDIEGYLEERKESLEELANKMAEKAKKTGKPVSIGNLNAHDRKIVHLALKNDRLVRTQSLGEGSVKKLVIFPKKKTPVKKRPSQEQIPSP